LYKPPLILYVYVYSFNLHRYICILYKMNRLFCFCPWLLPLVLTKITNLRWNKPFSICYQFASYINQWNYKVHVEQKIFQPSYLFSIKNNNILYTYVYVCKLIPCHVTKWIAFTRMPLNQLCIYVCMKKLWLFSLNSEFIK